jgi:hypothetical protein
MGQIGTQGVAKDTMVMMVLHGAFSEEAAEEVRQDQLVRKGRATLIQVFGPLLLHIGFTIM